MRGCTKAPRKPKPRKAGRGCSVAFKPGRRKDRRRRPPIGLIVPVLKGLKAMAR